MSWEYILIIALSSVVVLALIIWLIVHFSKKKEKTPSDQLAEDVVIKNKIRYTRDNKIFDENNQPKVSFNEGDALLRKGLVYHVNKKSGLLPGTYTTIGSDTKGSEFTVRVGGIVKTHNTGDRIVLGEGQTICAISQNVILR